MPLLNVDLDSVPGPFAVIGARSSAMSVEVKHPVILTWADGFVDAYPTDFLTVTADSAYGGTTVDATKTTYLLLAIQGHSAPMLFKESDVDGGNVDTILGAGHNWAVIRRICGMTIIETRQNESVLPGSPPPGSGGAFLRGDIWYYDNGWKIRHIGNQGDILTDANGVPVWSPLSINGSPVTPTPVIIQTSDTVAGTKALVIPPFTTPAGWPNPTFDDSTWPLALISPETKGFIVAATHEGPSGHVLFRIPFPLTAAELSNISFTLEDDSQYQAIYLNGVLVGGPSAMYANNMPPQNIPLAGGLLHVGKNLLAVWSINDPDPTIDPSVAYGGIRYTIAQSTTQIPPSAIGSGSAPGLSASVIWAHNDAPVGTEPTGSFNDSPSVVVTAKDTPGSTTVDYSFSVSGIGNIPIPQTGSTVASTLAGATITARVIIQSGGPPVNWDQPTFDDSAWPTAVHFPPSAGGAPDWVASPTHEGPFGVILFRDHFTVDLSTGLDHVVLHIACDDHLTALSLNGVPQAIIAAGNAVAVDYVFPRSALRNGTNLIALQDVNDADASTPTAQFGGVTYTITANTASIPQGLTLPAGVEGAMLIFHAGAWVVLPPGTAGQTLKMSGGLPTWV